MNGIEVSLFCPARHHVGDLVKNGPQIGFRSLSGQLGAWPQHQSDGWWEIRCPEGCPGVFGGAVNPIRMEVERLAADTSRTTAHYTLSQAG
jgi:hypothetical protein